MDGNIRQEQSNGHRAGPTPRRGRILRDTSAGEGLVFVDGDQYVFRLEGTWKSEFAPRVNMPVDVDFDGEGRVRSIRGLDPKALANEQAAQALRAAQDKAKKFAGEFQAKGMPVILSYVQTIGAPVLAAWAAVFVGWFWLPAVSLDAGFLGKQSFDFYDVLKLLNAGSGLEALARLGSSGAGFYGFLCIAALLAPALPHAWSDRRALLARTAPLCMILLVLVMVYWTISSGFSEASNAAGQFAGAEYEQYAREAANEARKQMMDAISIGLGTYLSFLGSAYLAFTGYFGYRAGAMLGQPKTA